MNKNFISIIFSTILLLLISNDVKIFSAAIIVDSSTATPEKLVVPEKQKLNQKELDVKLYQAVENKNKDEIGELLNLGANIHKPNDKTYLTPLKLSFEKYSKDPSFAEIVDLLVNTKNFDEEMQSAIRKGNLKEVESLLKRGARVNGIDEIGAYNNLMDATYRANKDIVKLLLTNKANVNFRRDIDGKTALHLATQYGNPDIIELLLGNGADINIADNSGNTPLILAAISCDKNIVRLLIEKQADINKSNNNFDDGDTALLISTKRINFFKPNKAECLEVVKLLTKNGAEINKPDLRKSTPLIIAVDNGQGELVKFLLAAGADLSYKDSREMNALELAKSRYRFDPEIFNKIIKVLEEEPTRREKVISAWNRLHNQEITKKIQDSTGIIPELSSIITQYAQIDKYEDLPLDYRLACINE